MSRKKSTQAGVRPAEASARDAQSQTRGAFLQQLLDLNPNFFFVRDREGRFVFVNKALADAYGTTVVALTGKTDADFNANPQEVETIRRSDLDVMESLQDKFIPESPILRDGRWVQTTKLPVVDADGVARQVLGISSDITERIQMEQTIQTSLERRGRQVQTATEVAQEIAAATALDELLLRVVTLVKERFGYYASGHRARPRWTEDAGSRSPRGDGARRGRRGSRDRAASVGSRCHPRSRLGA